MEEIRSNSIGICRCGSPIFGKGLLLAYSDPKLRPVSGEYCSVECVREVVEDYFGPKGEAINEKDCPPDVARETISKLIKMAEESEIPELSIDSRIEELKEVNETSEGF